MTEAEANRPRWPWEVAAERAEAEAAEAVREAEAAAEAEAIRVADAEAEAAREAEVRAAAELARAEAEAELARVLASAEAEAEAAAAAAAEAEAEAAAAAAAAAIVEADIEPVLDDEPLPALEVPELAFDEVPETVELETEPETELETDLEAIALEPALEPEPEAFETEAEPARGWRAIWPLGPTEAAEQIDELPSPVEPQPEGAAFDPYEPFAPFDLPTPAAYSEPSVADDTASATYAAPAPIVEEPFADHEGDVAQHVVEEPTRRWSWDEEHLVVDRPDEVPAVLTDWYQARREAPLPPVISAPYVGTRGDAAADHVLRGGPLAAERSSKKRTKPERSTGRLLDSSARPLMSGIQLAVLVAGLGITIAGLVGGIVFLATTALQQAVS